MFGCQNSQNNNQSKSSLVADAHSVPYLYALGCPVGGNVMWVVMDAVIIVGWSNNVVDRGLNEPHWRNTHLDIAISLDWCLECANFLKMFRVTPANERSIGYKSIRLSILLWRRLDSCGLMHIFPQLKPLRWDILGIAD